MNNIGVVSYAIGGCAFLVLSVLLATGWRGRFKGGVIVAAACISSIWCFWLAYQSGTSRPYTSVTVFLEMLRGGAWLFLLATLLRGDERAHTFSSRLAYALHALWMFALVYGASIGFRFRSDFPVWVVALLAIAIVGLVLVEQLYRNTRPEKRWAIKFLVLGLGGIFAYDFFLYSQALLLRGVEPELWNARGAVNALAVPLIAVAATRNPAWSVDVFVSRNAVFHAAALLGAGFYLLAMAAGGYYIQAHGGSWGAFAEIVFLGGAVLILAVIMLSAELRAKLRAFLVKHFYQGKYEYRVEWLRLIQTLAAPDQATPLGDRALQALAQIVDSPGGGLWLRREAGEFRPAARWGLYPSIDINEPADGPLVTFLERREGVIDLGQWRREPARYDKLVLPEWLTSQPRAWLVFPLMQENQLLGFAVLLRSLAAEEVTSEDTDLLKTVGRQVASYLAYQQAAQALAQARQFDAYHRLTAFIMHDLKNVIAQQSLVVKNADRHKHNPAFIEDVIRTVDNSVTRMNQLLDQLKRGEVEQRPRRVALPELLTEVVARQSFVQPPPRLQVGVDTADVLADAQGLAAILAHIVRNAQEATPPEGQVHVRLSCQGARAVIEVEDTGVGMEPAFLAERLFRPFDSTKGSKGMGIGAYQAREFVQAAGGNVEVTSTAGKGTNFRIVLPILGPEPADQPTAAIESRP